MSQAGNHCQSLYFIVRRRSKNSFEPSSFYLSQETTEKSPCHVNINVDTIDYVSTNAPSIKSAPKKYNPFKNVPVEIYLTLLESPVKWKKFLIILTQFNLIRRSMTREKWRGLNNP